MELSVVIPTLDEETSIGGCLDSVGTHADVEVVVSDGGSSDRTRMIARGKGARVVTGVLGRGPQLNLGAASSDSKKLLFLHADCRLPEGWLRAISNALDDDGVALTCFRLRTLSSRTTDASTLRGLWLRVFDLRSRGLGTPYGDQGFAVRRSIFDGCGGFPEIPLMEDVAFARSCRDVGRIECLRLEIQTTARRVENKPFKTTLMLTTFPILFRWGVAPGTLARWYGKSR